MRRSAWLLGVAAGPDTDRISAAAFLRSTIACRYTFIGLPLVGPFTLEMVARAQRDFEIIATKLRSDPKEVIAGDAARRRNPDGPVLATVRSEGGLDRFPTGDATPPIRRRPSETEREGFQVVARGPSGDRTQDKRVKARPPARATSRLRWFSRTYATGRCADSGQIRRVFAPPSVPDPHRPGGAME